MNTEDKKTFISPAILKEEMYQTAGSEHCHQVKDNDCDYVMKA